MSMDRHEPFEELISASLHGDLTADERERLDRHLDTCDRCRATLAAFADQRRIMSGLRHVPPPRDLEARIRTAIETGSRVGLPWWRRPQVLFAGMGGGLAVVAGAVLAIVLLNGSPNSPPVGEASPTASPVAVPSATTNPTLPPASAGPSAPSSVAASPTEMPIPSPEPDVFLALTGPVEQPQFAVENPDGDQLAEVDPPTGEPIAAELSPDGQWLAYITNVGQKGTIEVRATRIAGAEPSHNGETPPPIDSPVAVGDTVVLGEGQAGSPFLEHLFWSPESRYLAYTLADMEGGGTDAWIFQPQTGEPAQLTTTGTAYAASWAEGGAGTSFLWVSAAGDLPQSYLIPFHDDSTDIVPGDPADRPFAHAEHVFQPLVSPNGAYVIYWDGVMVEGEAGWTFSQGGQPWLANNVDDGQGGYEFTDSRELFRDLSVGREGFTDAAITWGADGDAYAVWHAVWTGVPQSSDSRYPDANRVYFGHASDPDGLVADHALDAADVPEGGIIVDVKVSPTGRHLVITARQPTGGVGEGPRADLLLVTRNLGGAADEVQQLGSAADGWFGPAAFDELP
jgi:hypothetical protein